MTAVEWLVDKLETEAITDYSFAQAHKVITLDVYSFNVLFEQAKEVEKEQIKDAFISGEHQQGYENESEQYYNETFKSE